MGKIKKAVETVKKNLGKKAFKKAAADIEKAKRDIDRGRRGEKNKEN